MLEGIIIKGVGGLYIVKVKDELYECKARGLFRKKKITPLIGDKVLIQSDDLNKTGYIMEICDRESQLIRPPVANVNQAIIVFAIGAPEPNLWLLDRFLLLAKHQDLDITICINKFDLDENGKINGITDIYEKAGYNIIKTSTKTGEGIEELAKVLENKITVFAGPSGVGKSTLLNKIQPNLELRTGQISKKTKRGKHTTRHTELMELNNGGWVLDTPGFSSLDINFIIEEELDYYFPEIYKWKDFCKFRGCKHRKEPKCEVKAMVESGDISESRYENYLMFLKEIEDNRRY
ncbi:ribosome small subunit-dependent GTPase A [Dethiothermospora halolimnae]|uniref:ribosome small subunit-dependent GTPase A n=1 Tax=Dethiothermospora halolimnae TaxID=3114390 RepID=UPI003CCC01CF